MRTVWQGKASRLVVSALINDAIANCVRAQFGASSTILDGCFVKEVRPSSLWWFLQNLVVLN